MYQLTFYVPVTHLEQVKNALFKAGAGKIGDYDCCAWQVLGTGQFRPLSGSTPFLGALEQLHSVAEYKVEMVCANAYIKTVLQVLIAQHPYQTPAYSVHAIKTLDDFACDC